MSNVLKNLEPNDVFHFFEEICNIPHGSGNVEQISNYLVDFAKERNLEVYQDAMKNVVIIKEATSGYEEEEPIIIQGHMDMVAVKKPDYDIDMKTDSLRLAIDGDNVYAEGTSLGGDDGIAVAYALALLDSDVYEHPRLEVIITVDEETGMHGAAGIDLSMLKGHRMLNIDSEEEGIFLTSCAGGAKIECCLPLKREKQEGNIYTVTIGGLQGGHSGCEIDKERGNSNSLFGRMLTEVGQKTSYRIVSMKGGLADNAIPRETTTQILVWENEDVFEEEIRLFEQKMKKELETKEPEFHVVLKKSETCECEVLTEESNRRAVWLLEALPNGVQAMSLDVNGLVETSLNIGIVKTTEQEMHIDISVRSSIESAKAALIQKVGVVTELCGGSIIVSGEYPGWAYRKDSPLRDTIIRVYQEMYGKEPEIQAIHAGLECGILSEKIPNLDCVSLGPDMKNIHTTEETLSISSVKRVWEFCLEVLKQKSK
ncbi:MAG: aminoacyl-histidine dipeptidase [Lachnospiraceae bacterium]|nr:aminoacyl-histidine dipeptidase [Lachnospiraceae bacterium]